MRFIWSWYRARRWWAKALIGAPVVLAAAVLLFIVVRFGMYQATSRTSAGEFTPSSAQVVLRCTGGAGQWERFQKSDAGKAILTKALRDTSIRGPINDALKANKLPTLNDLDDRRWHDKNGGTFREASILGFVGRDLMVAQRMADRPDQTRFCAATKIGFWHYCLTPFAGIVPGLDRIDIAGTKCLKIDGKFIAFVGPIAVISDDTALMAEALARKGSREAPPKAVRITVTFERSAQLNEWKKTARGMPFGLASVVVDPQPMTKLVIDVDVQGGEIVMEATASGVKPSSTDVAVTEQVRWTPAGGAGSVAINVSGAPFWQWLETASAAPPPNPSQMQKHGTELMRDAMRQLMQLKFPADVLPKVNGPLTILTGSVAGSENRAFAVLALVFKSDDPRGAMDALSRICTQALADASNQVQWVRSTESGFDAGHVRFVVDSFSFSDYKCPCVAIVNDTIVFANNFEFLRQVLATAAGDSPSLITEALFTGGQRRMAALGLKKIFGEGMVASGFMSGPVLRDGLEGYFPIWAATEVDTSENMRRFRAEIVTENQKAGRTMSPDEVTDATIDRMKVRKEEAETAMRTASKPLDYIRYAAFEVERAGEDGVRVRGAISIRSR